MSIPSHEIPRGSLLLLEREDPAMGEVAAGVCFVAPDRAVRRTPADTTGPR